MGWSYLSFWVEEVQWRQLTAVTSDLRVRKEINVTDRAEILSILQGAKSEHIGHM